MFDNDQRAWGGRGEGGVCVRDSHQWGARMGRAAARAHQTLPLNFTFQIFRTPATHKALFRPQLRPVLCARAPSTRVRGVGRGARIIKSTLASEFRRSLSFSCGTYRIPRGLEKDDEYGEGAQATKRRRASPGAVASAEGCACSPH